MFHPRALMPQEENRGRVWKSSEMDSGSAVYTARWPGFWALRCAFAQLKRECSAGLRRAAGRPLRFKLIVVSCHPIAKVHRPKPSRHNAHDCQCELGIGLDQRKERGGVDGPQFGVGTREDRRAPLPLIGDANSPTTPPAATVS